MMIEDFRHRRLAGFAGLPVVDFGIEHRADLEAAGHPGDVESWAWRVGVDGESSTHFPAVFELFLEAVDTTRVKALVIGNWCEGRVPPEPARSIAPLIEAAARFPALEALFFPDLTASESEVSFIRHADLSPLFPAFPRLRRFGLRGTTELKLEPFGHDTLEEVTFQGGGLPPSAVRAIADSRLPALNGLDLYLGTSFYGGGATAADLERILHGEAFPSLRHLGLRNAENTDELAAVLAHAPLLVRLESLDLSLGDLTDDGAAALLGGQPLTHLKRLDLHHHYLSDAMMRRIRQALAGVEVNLDEARGASALRYIAVAE